MTFDEWLAKNEPEPPTGFEGVGKERMRQVVAECVAAEREACAKICEAQAGLQDDAFRHGLTTVDGDLADRCAIYIRDRFNAGGKP